MNEYYIEYCGMTTQRIEADGYNWVNGRLVFYIDREVADEDGRVYELHKDAVAEFDEREVILVKKIR